MTTTVKAEMNSDQLQSILESILASQMLTTPSPTNPAKTEAGPTVESTQTTAVLDDEERPDHSYMDLIVMALSSMPGRQGPLHDIYRYISGRFPFYTKNRKHWKNSVRHNLTLHKCFKRLDTETDGSPILLPGVKKPKTSPLWSLLWNPDECPEQHNTRKRNRNKSTSKKRKGGKSETAGKSSTAKEAKSTQQSDQPPPASQPSTDDPLTRIAMMLPEIGSREAVPPSSSSALNQGLVQPPQTPESDYCSLSSDHSPYIPGQSLSAKSTCSSVFEYPSARVPSLPVQDGVNRRFSPLPLLSVDDICAVLQCDDCPPGSPDSGTGADILHGFGWFDELTPAEHHPLCLADSLLDIAHQSLNFQPEPPAVSFFVPKVPVGRPLSVDTGLFTW
ncbi:forkhead box protein S1-like [Patiria miniata]|uniref:Fork-head domain-containing protein n=1 Tax=Patiria miniata TaxID=46514 RepID=A0A914BTQ6_PATMI|nr:forkhead box protein S1-like [Patiria miniata]